MVEDKGTMPLRNTSTISITIGDVNDRVPQFQQASYTVRLPENSPPQQIQSLRYIDEDGLPENTESTLSIVSVTPQGMIVYPSTQQFPPCTKLSSSWLIHMDLTIAHSLIESALLSCTMPHSCRVRVFAIAHWLGTAGSMEWECSAEINLLM